LFHAALTMPDDERERFLERATANDSVVGKEVRSLLAANAQAHGFSEPVLSRLSTPAAVQAGETTLSGASLIGHAVGAYVVSARIGVGGMGEVYRARDQKLGRNVAIKILPAAFTSDPTRLARFGREARVLAALNHPHVGAIYGLEDAGPVRAL